MAEDVELIVIQEQRTARDGRRQTLSGIEYSCEFWKGMTSHTGNCPSLDAFSQLWIKLTSD